jgi:hypothetical protein
MTDEPTRPLIQIDDLVREMTDDEYAEYLARPATPPLGATNDADQPT